MPELVWPKLTALLYDRTPPSCVALAEVLETASHEGEMKTLLQRCAAVCRRCAESSRQVAAMAPA